MEMKKYKLGEIAKNITDGEHGTVIDDITGAYYLLSNKNIINGQILINPKTDRRINKETFDKINKRTKLEKGDVLISTVGTLGKTCIVEEKINYTLQRSVGIIKPNLDVLKSKYLMYLLMTDFYQNLLINNSKGAVQKCIFIDDLKQLPIQIPSLPTQQKIAAVLSSLDDKIALNKKINAKLEAMAKRLYDYWFVQFDFPNGEGKPYKISGGKMVWNEVLKREIPEGWEVKRLGEVVELLKDGTHNPPSRVENGIALLTGTMFGENFLDYTKATYIAKEDYFIIHSKYEPLENDIIITKIGTLGNINILRDTDIPIAIHCNSALLRFQNTFGFYYPFFFCKSALFQLRLKSVKGQSIQEFASLDKIASILCEIPKYEILISFNKTVKPIMKQMIRISKEIQKLTDLRDRLLPLLMNGQVEVEG